jgi:hypothetical protein
MASDAQLAAWRRALHRERERLAATQLKIAKLEVKIARAEERRHGRS